MSEYTHMQELLRETEQRVVVAEKRATSFYQAWESSNSDLNDARAVIAALEKRIETIRTTAFYATEELLNKGKATEAKWWEERQQMIMHLADKDEDIAKRNKRLAFVRTELDRLEKDYARGL